MAFQKSSVAALALLAALLCATGSSAAGHTRGLKVQPLPLPTPFAFPATVADSARTAYRAGRQAGYANEMCGIMARKDIQGSREFRDIDGVELWPMFINIGRAASIYGDEVARLWGQVFARCNAMGGMAAEGVGYGIAYIFAEGLVESLGMTKILRYAYGETNSCASVNNILDVAAAAIMARDVAADELHDAIETYEPKLAACTPRDAQLRFKPYSLKGNPGVVKSKDARSTREAEARSLAKAAPPAGAANRGEGQRGSTGSNGGGSGNGQPSQQAADGSSGRVAMERGRDTAGR